ncbi:MAG: TerD family protein, partial [Myxococcales bacterium]|nr:TerD family protein [Myxococcales bacterium]
LPEAIPLRENVALVFGRLLIGAGAQGHAALLPIAQRYLAGATDLLRLIAVVSGADAALQGTTIYETKEMRYCEAPWWEQWQAHAAKHIIEEYRDRTFTMATPKLVRRFPMAKLGRPTRRALLSLLEALDGEALIEDMLRHRSYWVWVGEFLHPGEYAKRFPKVARAFAVVRKRDPQGTPAERFVGFYGRVEAAAAAGDAMTMMQLLQRRPGEYARRFDHLLRVAGDNQQAVQAVVAGFVAQIRAYSTPVLLTLAAGLPTRARRAKLRMFWPKGGVTKGVSTGDRRPPLPAAAIDAARPPIIAELLRRFADRPSDQAPFATTLVDDALADIVAPFNERTASPSAVNLPRGSRVHVPAGKTMRLFLHWCERPKGECTDIDLSVGFYDAQWQYVGVCSYYQLTFAPDDRKVAVSSGDLTSAPYPNGASEFVDLDRAAARAAGIRYAVMVVNAYSGDPFDLLERGYAGLMLRDDLGGRHFDPRTVALKFALQGANGVYMPLCVDLDDDTLHWLDVYSTGAIAMNNVASSNAAITRICPETITYFASGSRMDMRTLALLHAAARCRRVVLRARTGEAREFVRREDEGVEDFFTRLLGEGGEPTSLLQGEALALGDAPVLALLHRGDLDLPEGSSIYALFRDQLNPTMTASDLAS